MHDEDTQYTRQECGSTGGGDGWGHLVDGAYCPDCLPAKLEETRAAGGALCERCDQRMLASDGCIGDLIETPRGAFAPIAFGEESFWGVDESPTERCHDCGCLLGRYHHLSCDVQECPACGGQYLAHELGEPCERRP